MLRDLVLLPALLALLFCFASAGTSPKKVVAARLDSSLVIDGILSETQWQAAVPVADFTQFDPAEGASPTESTLVRMLYDDHALYIGVLCRDRQPEGIVRQLIRRDRSSEADRFTVMIDSHHDHQTAFVFSTNVSG